MCYYNTFSRTSTKFVAARSTADYLE